MDLFNHTYHEGMECYPTAHTLLKRGKKRVELLFSIRKKSRNLRVRKERIKKEEDPLGYLGFYNLIMLTYGCGLLRYFI
jgi:hypothetical protein